MAKFEPETDDDNPPMTATFMAGMKPSLRGQPKLKAPKVDRPPSADSAKSHDGDTESSLRCSMT